MLVEKQAPLFLSKSWQNLNMRISAVVFDIGGVLIELNGLPSIARLLDSQQPHDEIYKQWMGAPSVIAHETGKISPAVFSEQVVQELPFKVSAQDFMADFITWIVGVFPDAIPLLKTLSSQCTVAALSNTSPPHWEQVIQTGLAEHFDHVFLSHEIGHLKPQPAAFKSVLQTLNCPAEEILFFDDNLENVEAATAMGFQSHQVFNPTEAKLVLTEYALHQA